MKVTLPQLIGILELSPGARICTVVTRTTPKLLVKHRITKLPCPYPNGVVHIAHRQIILGADYENLVNKQREREGNKEEFNVEQLWNGNGIHHSRFTVAHKKTGKLYFAYKPATGQTEHQPKVIRDEWFADGRELIGAELDDLDNYLPVINESKKQDVEKEVFWRTLDLSNLVALQCGEFYDIDHSIVANVSTMPIK